jgi:hypothetical protein
MFLRRIFKNMPDVGPWVSVAELLAAILTIAAILVGLDVVPNPFGGKVATGTISGMVTDAASGRPVPESTVQIIDGASKVMVFEKAPDAKGSFEQVLKPGAYTVKVVCDGYRPRELSVSVLEDQTRVVRLAIKQQTEAEARAAAQPGGASAASAVSFRAAVPSVGAGASRPVSHTAGGSQPPGKSKAELVEQQFDLAKQLYEAGRYQDAKDACAAALKYDPTDGRIYAKLVLLNVDPDCENLADAKDWAREGKQKAKKNRDELNRALLEIPSE